MKRGIVILMLIACSFNAQAQWQTIFKDSVNYSFDCAYFINNDTGFVGGFYYPPCFRNGIIFRTLDGGQTWDTSLVSPYISAIQFINDSIGFTGGQDAFVYKTSDLGEHWSLAGFRLIFFK
jgi:photosystem II stability/assembly factor-like uncharacterized protein